MAWNASLMHRNQYLAEMGVDVWVLRQEGARYLHAPSASPREDASPKRPAPQPATPRVAVPAAKSEPEVEAPRRQPRTPVSTEPVPEFHLCFMNYSAISLVFNVPMGAESLPASLSRFGEDVALAYSGDSQGAVSALKWPMVRSTHIDQSEGAARIVLGQRVAKCATHVVVFGKSTASWLGEPSGHSLLIVDEVESYLTVPGEKRALWGKLLEFRKEAGI